MNPDSDFQEIVPGLAQWWRQSGLLPKVILVCGLPDGESECHEKVGEVRSSIRRDVVLLTLKMNDRDPVPGPTYTTGESFGLGGILARDREGRTLTELADARQEEFMGSVLRELPDGRYVTKRFTDTPILMPLSALCMFRCENHGPQAIPNLDVTITELRSMLRTQWAKDVKTRRFLFFRGN